MQHDIHEFCELRGRLQRDGVKPSMLVKGEYTAHVLASLSVFLEWESR